jgi:hypothetical protein
MFFSILGSEPILFSMDNEYYLLENQKDDVLAY